MVKVAWNWFRWLAGELKDWLWPFLGAVLLVLYARLARRADQRKERAEAELADAIEDQNEGFREDVDRELDRARKAQEKARRAEARVENTRDELAEREPTVGDFMHRYDRNRRLRNSSDAT